MACPVYFCDDERVKWTVLAALLLLSACRPATKPLVDPELSAYLPAGATAIAGIDVDRLRSTPLFAYIPAPFRDGSYTLVGYDGQQLVTASRVGTQVKASGP